MRPVSEIAYKHDFGGVEMKSALLGAIWQVKEDLAVDAGLRAARTVRIATKKFGSALIVRLRSGVEHPAAIDQLE